MNEAETRAEHIDPALAAAGWGAVGAAASDAKQLRLVASWVPGSVASRRLPIMC